MCTLHIQTPIMNCLIVAATIQEIAPFLIYVKDPKNNLSKKLSIDILITGIGLTASTYRLSNHFAIKKTDMVIQAGLAGCFDKKISLGTVVAIKQDTIADESVVESKKLKTLFDLKLISLHQFPYKNGWLINIGNPLLKKSNLKKVKSISVNHITTDKKMIRLYEKCFNPVTESMEGAALHYVCLMKKIPFLQIRSISNYMGERNKKKWDLKNAIVHLNNELIRLLETI